MPISLVTNNTAGSSSPYSITTPTAGNVLLGCFANRGAGSTTTLSSVSQTNVTWTFVGRAQNATAPTATVEIWWGKVNASPGSSITLTWASGGTNNAYQVAEFSGVDTTSPVDGSVATNTGSSTTASSGTYTSANANDVLFHAVASASSTAPSAPTLSFTLLRGLGAGSGSTTRAVGDAYRIVTSATSYTSALTVGNSVWASALVGFKEANTNPLPSVSDSATGAESVTLLINRLVPSVSDNATGAETTAVRPQVQPSVSDNATGTESISGATIANASAIDNATGSESTSLSVNTTPSISDNATGTESVTILIPTLVPSVSDNSTGADSATLSITVPVNIADLATGADSVSIQANVALSLSDNSTVADVPEVNVPVSLTLSDDATGADSQSQSIPVSLSVSDDSTGSESQSQAVNTSLSIADDATGSESQTLDIPVLLSISDDNTGSESQTLSIQNAGEVQANVSDDSTGSESISIQTSAVQLTVSDLSIVADAPAVGVNVLASISDDATVEDSTTQALIVTINVSDSANASEAISARVSASLSAVDLATVADLPTVVVNRAGITGTAYVVQDPNTGAATGTIHLIITGVQYAVQNPNTGFQVGYVGAPPAPFTITRNILGVGK